MLGYDQWSNNTHSSSPQLILSDVVELHHQHGHHHNNVIPSSSSDHHHHQQQQSHHSRPIFDDHFNTPYTFPHDTTPQHPQPHHHQHNTNNPSPFYQPQLFHDPRAYHSASSFPPSMLTLDSLSGPAGFNHVIPKSEPDPTLRPIGLNLGGRTYFSPDDDLMSRLYRRSRPADVAANAPKCQAEGCNADLSNAKHYHRRHKVCEFHSKASTVIAAGLTQRFCQQCSRFHLLAEFDNGKRSCRKRLADHNRRRRKSHQLASQDHRMAVENARASPSQSLERSPASDSGIHCSSSVTVAVSPPRVSIDSSFMQRLYH